MKPKVCILAAGVGTSLKELSQYVAPCILPVNFKASISYIIEKFDEDTEIIITVGHKKDTIKGYLELAYPERRFTFVEVDKFMGPESGAGHSLLHCKNYLQCPFIYFAADTIVIEDIPEVNENWMGVAPTKEPENYCTIKSKNDLIYQIDNKVKTDNKMAFIGVAGIKDYEDFWVELERCLEAGKESDGIGAFKALVNKKLSPRTFTWFDTGSFDKYIETNNSFIGGENSFDFSKNDEFLYFVNGKVIKFFENAESARKRVERAKVLEGLCPKIEGHNHNFYSYKKVKGNTLYEVVNPHVLRNLLHWANRTLWVRKELTESEMEEFKDSCRDFYYNKTIERVNAFHKKNNVQDSINMINGVYVPTLKELLEKVPWENLFNGIPARFHGDFTVGNILVSRDPITNLERFTLLDWRHGFANSTEVGDLYYDLAKLYKGLFLSDELIKKNMFSFEMSGTNVFYEYFLTRRLVEAREEFDSFLIGSEFDEKKVKILSAICLLNMSPLHKYPFNFLVYYLGKSMLNKLVNGEAR